MFLLCEECAADIEYKGRGRFPKYCKRCAYKVDLRKSKRRSKKRREENKYLGLNVGTTDFSSQFSGNFKKEQEEIDKEFKKLKLKKRIFF